MSTTRWGEPIVWIIADGTALTAAARASLLQGAASEGLITLRNNFFDHPGKMIRISAQGRISCVVTTPGTARFDVAFNTIAQCDSAALNLNIVAKVNVPWWLEIVGICRSVGSGVLGTIMWFGSFQSEAVVGSPLPTVGGNGSLLFTNGGVGATALGATFNTIAAIPLDLNFTQTVATGSIQLQQYKVEELN